MKSFISSVIVALLIATSAGNLSADDLSDAKRVDIATLMEMTGALALGKQMSDVLVAQMTQAIKASRPDLAPELFDILRDEVNRTIEENLPNFVAVMVPVYHKYFTHEDIKGMLRFYQTPLGQKAI